MSCQVRGCRTADADPWVSGDAELRVCWDHAGALESGADWVLDQGTGAVLLGAAAPPTVVATSAVGVIGSPGGLLLKLTVTRADGVEDLEMVLPPDEAEILRGLLERWMD